MPGLNDLTNEQVERVDMLMRHGWSLDKVYGDRAVSMSKVVRGRADGDEFTERVMVFVDLDGYVHQPRTNGTMVACAELHDMELVIK